MKYQTRIICGILISLFFLPCFAHGDEAAISATEYRERLDQYSATANSLDEHPEFAAQLLADIPDKLAVNTGTREVTVDFHDLKNDLAALSAANESQRPAEITQIRNYLGALRDEAANITQASNAAEQTKLHEILARHEFHKVKGPGIKDTLLSKIFAWVARWLSKIHIGSGNTSNVLQALVYTVVGLALLLALVWTIRSLRRKDEEMFPREIIPFAPSAKNWRTWLAEARQSAASQDWRNAIHLAYWAGISSLESGGAWKPNRARTPREYLRLLSTRNPNYSPLTALTRKFEVVWYGDRVAIETDFLEALNHLEQLGCR